VTFKLLGCVRLKQDIPKQRLENGLEDTIIEVFEYPRQAFEVGPVDNRGGTAAQVSLDQDQIGGQQRWNLEARRAIIDQHREGLAGREQLDFAKMKTRPMREKNVREWMIAALDAGHIEPFNDLHIDQIDPSWKDKKHWVRAGLEALQIATSLRNRDGLGVDIALTFSLRSGERPRGVDFRDSVTFQAELDWSPPSLYLLKPGKEPYSHRALEQSPTPVDMVSKRLDPVRFGFAEPVKACYFMEFKSMDSPEYARTVVFVG
jgi:hypothetical protein